MDIWEKYNLEKNDFVLCKELPKKVSHFIYYLEKNNFNELYINTNGNLKLIVTKPSNSVPLLLFLKKYRPHPELLPKNLKYDYPFEEVSSAYIDKAMQVMLKPMNTFEEFKERLLFATEELMPYRERTDISRFGEKLVFVNKKEDCGSIINIYGEVIPCLKENNGTYWERTFLFDRENKIFEYWIFPERTNDTPDKRNWKLDIKFYEEKYFYEYLLNKEIAAVRS